MLEFWIIFVVYIFLTVHVLVGVIMFDILLSLNFIHFLTHSWIERGFVNE